MYSFPKAEMTSALAKSPIFLKEEHVITNEISFLVRTESQLKYLLDKDVLIYVECMSLYNKYKDYKNVFYRSSRIKPNNQDNTSDKRN